jgi:hypothetical protein
MMALAAPAAFRTAQIANQMRVDLSFVRHAAKPQMSAKTMKT